MTDLSVMKYTDLHKNAIIIGFYLKICKVQFVGSDKTTQELTNDDYICGIMMMVA